jgi:hypothetical protein
LSRYLDTIKIAALGNMAVTEISGGEIPGMRRCGSAFGLTGSLPD